MSWSGEADATPHFGEGHSYQKKFEEPWPWLIGYQQIKGEGAWPKAP
jgi:hypothetical protein